MSGKEALAKEDASSGDQALTDLENQIKEVCAVLKRETVRLRSEQKSIDSVSKKMEGVHFTSTVKLNVGGLYFTTSLQTLTKDQDSMLAAMFSGRFEMKPSEDGAYFIDRDGTHFRFILNYLRTGKLILPDDATLLKEVEEEAEFYQLQGIIDQVKSSKPKPPKDFEESGILNEDEHRSVLLSWLGPQNGEWRLLFRASRDGWSASDFHTRCDNKGPTVTIVKSGSYIFGGFTEQPWLSAGEWKQCSQAFLFSMISPSALGPTKMALVQYLQHGMHCNSGYGPTFGGGHDLHIAGNANTSNNSYSNLGFSYQCPTGQNGTTFLAGAQYFTVADYEVFGLHK